MGIVNVTPDSFSDGGKYFRPKEAVRRALNLIDEGADIIDIGAESTRPGSVPISWEEEWSRLEPVLKGLSPSSVGVLVVGSPKSSNTGKLADIAERAGAKSWCVSGTDDLPAIDFPGIEVLGVTSGASTPEDVFDDVLEGLSPLT